MRKLFAVVAFTAMSVGLPAAGQGVSPETYSDDSFCSADYSPEGAGTEEEAADRYGSEFAEMDLDGDGMVSQEEYIACREAAADTTD